jgi:hypothetical protein
MENGVFGRIFFENKYFIFFIICVVFICVFNMFYIMELLENIVTMKSFFYVDFFIFDDECRFFDFEI